MRIGRIAIVFRGDPSAPKPPPTRTRLAPVFDALAEVGLIAEFAAYNDRVTDEVRSRLLALDGALVWVDPVTGSDDRTKLDAVLRDVASQGVWVSAHPDTILKMGTKEVLFDARQLGWGADTDLYRSVDDFAQHFPERLGAGGARVLKQYRGNGGIGVQKVELIEQKSPPGASVVRVQSARMRDEEAEDITLGEFMQRCTRYFAYSDGAGRLIDQPFQPRITEGMIRCYLVKGEVVGFARQYPHDQSPSGNPAAARRIFGLPAPKTMYPPDEPTFRSLRANVESEWVPAMQTLVDVDDASLPALWDADFLYGPKQPSGDDSYVLCEINVSSVLPFPPEAPPKLARATLAALGRSD
jgi:glutathione synthase/RimK-type ligase-like ATP-grasp enzyme